MLFNSLDFLVFFPVVVALYFVLPHRARWGLLLVGSYAFYGHWNWAYVPLLIASTGVDYAMGRCMARRKTRAARRPYLLVSLAANLGLLFTFKYLGFFATLAASAAQAVGAPLSLPTLDLLLPIGISFYTFQTLSYSLDVYRGRQAAEPHAGYFALYVSFFPQLVAGPIERASALLPQLRTPHAFDWTRVREGGLRMLWGFFKKVVIADGLATFTAKVYADPAGFSGFVVLVAAYAFVYQLYCDFSGYTDIAIGAAHVLGIRLSENFRRPFAATSARALWQRWHISLMRWIRDYLYLPAARRVSSTAARIGLSFLTLFAFGIWHGAGTPILAFSVFIATITTLESVVKAVRRHQRVWRPAASMSGFAVAGGPVPLRIRAVLGRLYVYTMFALACIMLRADDAATMHSMFRQLVGVSISWSDLASIRGVPGLYNTALFTACIAVVELVESRGEPRDTWAAVVRQPQRVRWSAYGALLVALLVFGTFHRQPFVYFQF